MPLSRCSLPHCNFPPNADDLLYVRSCSLANVLLASRFPSYRPDTASFRSCLLLPLGFLGTLEAGNLRRKPCVFPLLFLLVFPVPVDLCKVIQAAAGNVSSCVVEM